MASQLQLKLKIWNFYNFFHSKVFQKTSIEFRASNDLLFSQLYSFSNRKQLNWLSLSLKRKFRIFWLSTRADHLCQRWGPAHDDMHIEAALKGRLARCPEHRRVTWRLRGSHSWLASARPPRDPPRWEPALRIKLESISSVGFRLKLTFWNFHNLYHCSL